MSFKLKETESRVKVRDAAELSRGGGENRPYDYPHLYQIQAGDWRISYAVEQNHLAILVLEVLNPDGTSRKDPARENLTRKMKVKLLDWPEGSRDLPPEDLGKKVKIKLLDLTDDPRDEQRREPRAGHRIRLAGANSDGSPTRRITLLEGKAREPAQTDAPPAEVERDEDPGRKVTPLNSPST